MKILIIQDRFQFRGGGERLVLDLAKSLNADILTEYWTKETFDRSEAPGKIFVLDEGEAPMIVWRYFRAQWNFWWKTRKIISAYDVVIFSGNNCLSAALIPLPKQKRIYYCHTPVRYVYDLLAHRRQEEPSPVKRFFYYDLGKWLIRTIYNLGLSRMPTIVTNSQAVHDRLKTYCQRESHIVYPPVRTDLFTWISQEPYYLSFARLDPLKRIDRIVKAFQQMPTRKLVIASSGPCEKELREMAKDYPNITILGRVEDAKLKELVGSCVATIYIPINEDFGMSPLEGMSAGKPCIGVDEGGLRETIIPGKTGALIPKACEIEDLVSAVEQLTPEVALPMRADCEAQAKKFDVKVFAEKMRALVYEARD